MLNAGTVQHILQRCVAIKGVYKNQKNLEAEQQINVIVNNLAANSSKLFAKPNVFHVPVSKPMLPSKAYVRMPRQKNSRFFNLKCFRNKESKKNHQTL
jgi:hypothetical protein